MKDIPKCPDELPVDIVDKVRSLGAMWSQSDSCPKIEDEVKDSWKALLEEWVADETLPLLIRKSSEVRGSEIHHESGRIIIPTDNSPAQWSCNWALQGRVPTIDEIRNLFENDKMPVSFAVSNKEKIQRRYNCILGKDGINDAGWKLCHIEPVGLKTRTSLRDVDIDKLYEAFRKLMSPSNYFLLPKILGGLGEVEAFILGHQGLSLECEGSSENMKRRCNGRVVDASPTEAVGRGAYRRQNDERMFRDISTALARRGFVVSWMSDSRKDVDFIACPVDDHDACIYVKLKTRLFFSKKYLGKGLYIAFSYGGRWYVYPHDDMLRRLADESNICNTVSWTNGVYHFQFLSAKNREILERYAL